MSTRGLKFHGEVSNDTRAGEARLRDVLSETVKDDEFEHYGKMLGYVLDVDEPNGSEWRPFTLIIWTPDPKNRGTGRKGDAMNVKTSIEGRFSRIMPGSSWKARTSPSGNINLWFDGFIDLEKVIE